MLVFPYFLARYKSNDGSGRGKAMFALHEGWERQRPADGGVVFAGRRRLTGGRPRTAVAKPATGHGTIADSPPACPYYDLLNGDGFL